MQKRDKVLHLKIADNTAQQPQVFFHPPPPEADARPCSRTEVWGRSYQTNRRVAARGAAGHARLLQPQHGSMPVAGADKCRHKTLRVNRRKSQQEHGRCSERSRCRFNSCGQSSDMGQADPGMSGLHFCQVHFCDLFGGCLIPSLSLVAAIHFSLENRNKNVKWQPAARAG